METNGNEYKNGPVCHEFNLPAFADDDRPLVNSWTEFGDLEYICVGSALNACYADRNACFEMNYFPDDCIMSKYLEFPLGQRPKDRIMKAEAQLLNLVSILEGETVTVGSVTEFDEDIRQDLIRKRCLVTASGPKTFQEDKRIKKEPVPVVRPPVARFDHEISTPWFKNRYQFGIACPRDTIITLGNTILEAPTGFEIRYFESNYMRPIISKLWDADRRVHWKTAPQPTCDGSMYDTSRPFNYEGPEVAEQGYWTPLNETQVAFDAADIMRVGKDIFYKRSASANVKGLHWLRREFPSLRFHMAHFPTSLGPHLDTELVPLRPPTAGSDGLVLINQNFPPLASEMELWKRNDWTPHWSPLPATEERTPVPICSPNLNMNLLSLSSRCVIIEEAEIPLYHYLEDLGFDVITAPLRYLNEFGGGVHCVTWDIRRKDSCTDYFPDQDYATECELDLNNFYEAEMYSK